MVLRRRRQSRQLPGARRNRISHDRGRCGRTGSKGCGRCSSALARSWTRSRDPRAVDGGLGRRPPGAHGMSDVDDLDPLAAHDAAWDAQRRQWFDHEVRHQKTYEPDNDDRRPNGQAAPPPGWTPTVIDVGEDFEPIPPRGWLLGATF